jgi:hypothetical protein
MDLKWLIERFPVWPALKTFHTDGIDLYEGQWAKAGNRPRDDLERLGIPQRGTAGTDQIHLLRSDDIR